MIVIRIKVCEYIGSGFMSDLVYVCSVEKSKLALLELWPVFQLTELVSEGLDTVLTKYCLHQMPCSQLSRGCDDRVKPVHGAFIS